MTLAGLQHFQQRWPWIGPDLQTLRNRLTLTRPALDRWPCQSLELPLKDGTGDRLLAILQQPEDWDGARLLVLLHGLTGCSESAYIRNSADFFLGRGEAVLRLNLRGAGPGRQYSAGSHRCERT